MTRTPILFCLSLLLAACDRSPRDRFRLPIQPTAVSNPIPPPAPLVRAIQIGEEVHGLFAGYQETFEFTAPTTGRLLARLTWDAWFNGTILTLRLGDTQYTAGPPLVGACDVVAGQTYRLTISPGGTDWFYNDAYVLTTAIE